MTTYLLIFLGCGIGGILRYTISSKSYLYFGQNFPYGTLIVNLTGSFVMGLLFVFIERCGNFAPHLRVFLLIGILGGYTTFSSFSMETINLIEQGAILKASLNIGLSVILCITAAWSGVILGRQL